MRSVLTVGTYRSYRSTCLRLATTFDDQKTMLCVSGRSVVRGLKPKTYDVIVGLP